MSSNRTVGYFFDSMDLFRSRSRRSLPVFSVLTGNSTQPRTSDRLPPVISPVTDVVVPVNAPAVARPSKLRTPSRTLPAGIASWAARLGVPLEAVEVEVEADFDARGELGMDGVAPGYQEVRYLVAIASPAPRDEVDRLLATAERASPYLDIFGREVALRRTLRLNGAEA